MKMVSERLKMLILKVHIIVSALMHMKYGCIGIGFIRLVMIFSVMK